MIAKEKLGLRILLKADKEELINELYACPDWSIAVVGRLTEEEIGIVESAKRN